MSDSQRLYAASKPIQWYADPAHEWLAVPLALVKALGIAERVSTCSYVDHLVGVAYLEGDCDAALFIEAVEKLGQNLDVTHLDGDCYIRDLPRFPI